MQPCSPFSSAAVCGYQSEANLETKAGIGI